MKIHLKRVYEKPTSKDGTRILVDRLWPRGLSKEKARIDRWLKEVSPSSDLRRRFHGDPSRWEEFREAYFRELDDNPDPVDQLRSDIQDGPVTLLFASKDERHNNAKALKEYLEEREKRKEKRGKVKDQKRRLRSQGRHPGHRTGTRNSIRSC